MLESTPFNELEKLIDDARKGMEPALVKLQKYYNAPLIGHIRGSTDYISTEDENAVIADTWEYIFSRNKQVGATFYSQLTRASDVILRRHKIRNLALRAGGGDDNACRFLKKVYGKKIRDFFQYNKHIHEVDILDSLENKTWMYCFEKIKSLEKGKSYNPVKASFMTWVRLWANILAMRYQTQISKRCTREIPASALGSEEDPLDLENLQPDENSTSATFSRIHDPARQFEDRSCIHDCYRELLCTVFYSGAKPHQLISFVYNKLLEWKPQEIVDLLSHNTLWDSGAQGYKDYASFFSDEENSKSAAIVDDSFTPLFLQLKQVFETIYTEHKYEPLKRIYSGVQIGLTKLEIYFGTDEQKSLSQWTFKLKKNVRQRVSIELNPFFSS